MTWSGTRTLRIGTRSSKLARWQADWVAARLRNLGHGVEIVEITTSGDTHQLGPVADIGSPGVFTKEVQRAVIAGEADLAVHSLKDLPTDAVEELLLVAVPPRESPADVLVAHNHLTLEKLPQSARVGTGSLRRHAQLQYARSDLRIESIRGNVDTRVLKLDNGDFDAIVLAEAGLTRLGLAGRISQVLPFAMMLPAVGQGALGIECRADDKLTAAALIRLNDADTYAAVSAERSLLAHLRGGCLAPIGALGRIDRGRLQLEAVVLDSAGSRRLAASEAAPVADAIHLGRRVADELLGQGAAELIAASRS
jgi:hydroxymethylbilane synthase